MLFLDDDGEPTTELVKDKPGGWIMRCKACLDAQQQAERTMPPPEASE